MARTRRSSSSGSPRRPAATRRATSKRASPASPVKKRTRVTGLRRATKARPRRKISATVAKAAAKLTEKATKLVSRVRRRPAKAVTQTAAKPWGQPFAPGPEAPQASSQAFRALQEEHDLPSGYGDHHIVLLVKDPWWLFAYWEIQPHRERELKQQLSAEELSGLQSVVRVYDVTDLDYPGQPAHSFFDVPLSGMAMQWYLHTNAPDREFLVEIGLLTRQGRFLMLARSNRVRAPRASPSEVIDGEWMTAEELYWNLLGMSAGIGMGASQSGLKAALASGRPFSGAVSSGLFSPVKNGKRDFWLWLDAELVLYGATDPKAAVTIQGQPVTLKSDGTFSVRLSLPDGAQSIPVQATSPDKRDRRTITSHIERSTESASDANPRDAAQPRRAA